MIRTTFRFGALLALAACGHSDPFTAPPLDQQGPFSTAARRRLTFNSGADFAPNWTADGNGIIYSFADPSRADHDRCLAILPALGGTRIFTLCDNRPGHADSAETIASGALAEDGTLLYLVGAGQPIDQIPPRVTLFQADTAAPFARRALLTLPADVGGGLRPNWLLDIRWTGPEEFVAMAADWTVVPQCIGCGLRDTVFTPLGVVRGTIGSNGVVMSLIAGTEGSSFYSLAEGGASVVLVNGLNVFKVPRLGGAITPLTTLPSGIEKRIIDISCRGTTCLVASFEIVVPPPPATQGPQYRLSSLSTAGGSTTVIESDPTGAWTAARLSPASGDLLLRIGPPKTGDLFLYRNFLP